MELRIPRENANDDQVIIGKVLVQSGDTVSEGEVIFEFETSKASLEFVAPTSGVVNLTGVLEGEEVAVDSVIGSIGDEIPKANSPVRNEALDTTEDASDLGDDSTSIVMSDTAARMAAGGAKVATSSLWVTSKDFTKRSTRRSRHKAAESSQDSASQKTPTSGLDYKEIKGDNRKKLEIQSLSFSSPYLNSTLGVSIQIGPRLCADGFFNNSILDLVMYETGNLLKGDFSDLNAFYLGDNKVAKYSQVVGGFAIDTERNLTVLRVDALSSLPSISDSIISKVSRFDEGKLKAEDVAPTTFTITDLSGTEVEYVLPLINGEQAFILGITKNADGFNVFGTFDHRVTEGRRFGDFLSQLKLRVEAFAVISPENAGPSCSVCRKTMAEELSLGGYGFIQIQTKDGLQLLCRNCYDGW